MQCLWCLYIEESGWVDVSSMICRDLLIDDPFRNIVQTGQLLRSRLLSREIELPTQALEEMARNFWVVLTAIDRATRASSPFLSRMRKHLICVLGIVYEQLADMPPSFLPDREMLTHLNEALLSHFQYHLARQDNNELWRNSVLPHIWKEWFSTIQNSPNHLKEFNRIHPPALRSFFQNRSLRKIWQELKNSHSSFKDGRSLVRLTIGRQIATIFHFDLQSLQADLEQGETTFSVGSIDLACKFKFLNALEFIQPQQYSPKLLTLLLLVVRRIFKKLIRTSQILALVGEWSSTEGCPELRIFFYASVAYSLSVFCQYDLTPKTTPEDLCTLFDCLEHQLFTEILGDAVRTDFRRLWKWIKILRRIEKPDHQAGLPHLIVTFGSETCGEIIAISAFDSSRRLRSLTTDNFKVRLPAYVNF